MNYGEGPPDGFSESEWRSALRLQDLPEERLTSAQRKLLARPRLWNGTDPHSFLWTVRERRYWDAMIYSVSEPVSFAKAA